MEYVVLSRQSVKKIKTMTVLPSRWPTFALFAATVLIFTATFLLLQAGIIGFLPGVMGFWIAAYLAFTPMHEATHGNVGRFARKLRVDCFMGWLSGLITFAPFSIFRALHLQHHRRTNHPHLDPDMWVATSNWLSLILRCLTIWPAYIRHFIVHTRISPATMFYVFVDAAAIIGVCWLMDGDVIICWVMGSIFALACDAFAFDWLVHYPHKNQGGIAGTRNVCHRGFNKLTLGNCIHQIHHINPSLPWYQLQAVLDEVNEAREKQNESEAA